MRQVLARIRVGFMEKGCIKFGFNLFEFNYFNDFMNVTSAFTGGNNFNLFLRGLLVCAVGEYIVLKH